MITSERYELIKDKCSEKGYTLLTKQDDIVNNQSYITYICPIHGEYTTRVTSIMQGKSCYKCSRQTALKKRWAIDIEERAEKLYEMVNIKCSENGYKLLSGVDSINGYKSRIRYMCPAHGEKHMTVGNMLNGKRCRECYNNDTSKRLRKDIDDVIDKIKLCGGELLNPSDYINNSERNLIIKCPCCGNEFVTSLVLFTQHGGQCCESCYRKESIGERKIRQYLDRNNIKYEQEKYFKGCVDERPLRFDFYLSDKNIVIEFDGEQHFNDTHYFVYDISKNKLHDDIKNKYCKDNGIKIIRIPYWNINSIENILEKEIA